MSEITTRFSIQSYIDKNREKLDEALVSLRIMKEIDKFLDYKNLSNKDLANGLGYSESYISQLMSGIKKVNTSFISKFEKKYGVRFDFKVYLNNENVFLQRLDERRIFKININLNTVIINNKKPLFSFKQNSKSMFEVTDADFETL